MRSAVSLNSRSYNFQTLFLYFLLSFFFKLLAEINLVQKQIPRIIRIFTKQGVKVSWIITFNRSYIGRRKLSSKPFSDYMNMIKELASGIEELDKNVLFYDWGVMGGNKIGANREVLDRFDNFVSKNALRYEVDKFLQMLKQFPDALSSKEELINEMKQRIAFEAEEAKYLDGPKSPFLGGKFILIPLEKPERYVFFDALAPEFTKRIVTVVRLYPWRIEEEGDDL